MRSKIGPLTLFVVLISAVYLWICPIYVQGGDTGEMVAAGRNLFVPHPPGFPLWVWLLHFWTWIFNVGSVFWRASVLTALFSIFSLIVIGYPIRRQLHALLICLPILSLSTGFIDSAVLPDVFSLNGFFVSLIGSIYLFSREKWRWRSILIPFLFFFGLSNQPTLLWLFPVVLAVALESKWRSVRSAVVSATVGVIFSVSLYMSFLSMHPLSLYSWGTIQDYKGVWRHLMRVDYGSLHLSAAPNLLDIAPLWSFLKTSFLEVYGLLVITVWLYFKNRNLRRDVRLWAWGVGTLLSVLFFVIANVRPEGVGVEVLRRFHMMPLIMLTLMTAYALSKNKVRFKTAHTLIAVFLILPSLVLLGIKTYELRLLREDSIFEDYAINLLKEAGSYKPALIVVHNDGEYFALRYAQSVLGYDQPGIGVVAPELLFYPWFNQKLRVQVPNYSLPKSDVISRDRSYDFLNDFILPNLARNSVFVAEGYQEAKLFRITYLGLGRVLTRGHGVTFDLPSMDQIHLRREWVERSAAPQLLSEQTLFARYSHFYIAKGLEEKNSELAIANFNKAIERVPYATVALSMICQLTKGSDKRCNSAGPK